MAVLHQVVAAEPSGNGKVRVAFENGATGVFDCSPYMADEYWATLKESAFFRQVRAECGTLCWPNDIDMDPEEIWEDTVFDKSAPNVWHEADNPALFVAEDGPERGAKPEPRSRFSPPGQAGPDGAVSTRRMDIQRPPRQRT